MIRSGVPSEPRFQNSGTIQKKTVHTTTCDESLAPAKLWTPKLEACRNSDANAGTKRIARARFGGFAQLRDKAIIDGIYEPDMIPKPLISVSDAAGVVVEAGPNVSRFESGDHVTSHLYSKWIDGLPGPDEPKYCFALR